MPEGTGRETSDYHAMSWYFCVLTSFAVAGAHAETMDVLLVRVRSPLVRTHNNLKVAYFIRARHTYGFLYTRRSGTHGNVHLDRSLGCRWTKNKMRLCNDAKSSAV